MPLPIRTSRVRICDSTDAADRHAADLSHQEPSRVRGMETLCVMQSGIPAFVGSPVDREPYLVEIQDADRAVHARHCAPGASPESSESSDRVLCKFSAS